MAIYMRCFRLQSFKFFSTRTSEILQLLNKDARVPYAVYRRCKYNMWICQYIQLNRYHTSCSLYKRRKTAEERKSSKLIEYSPKAKSEIVDVWRGITPSELSEILNQNLNYVYEIFLNQVHHPHTPIDDIKVLQLAIRRSGRRMRIIANPKDITKEVIKKDAYPRPPPKKDDLKPRPPVVTVMGHVDHGKTTLLDSLRQSNVVNQEFGGITQHIGAFSVTLKSGAKITFLDTPGHAAFTSMRKRGANVTDIVILVVAADDGVMEQTVESVRMARQAQVPILVAINKIDSPKADIEKAEKMLLEIGLQVEKLGGDIQAVPISALKKQNLDQLTEALILQAELLEIGGDPTGPVEATVIESQIHPHRGKLCTVIVQRGTLKKGDILVADAVMGRVRALKDEEGKPLQEVAPGYPAEIEGWKELPPAGAQVLQVESEKRAREVLKVREGIKDQEKLEEDAKEITKKMEQHNREYKEKLEMKRRLGRYKLKREGPRQPEISKDDNTIPTINLIVKADVDGTLEALLDTLDTYESTECKMDLVHYGVGSIIPTDVELAETFNAIIYAFNVDVPPNLKKTAEELNVVIKHFNVIYKLIDDIKEEINVTLPPKDVEETLGEAVVLQQFEITQGRKKNPVAGCRCVKGSLKRTAMYKIIRNGEVIHTGTLSSMRHLKDEVDVIKIDTECGLQLSEKSVNFQQGDKIICYEIKTIHQKINWDPGF
ncbi:translation initiation factor IF-2, mitochondrial [Anoplophora glabripennis]|nr:translation initiation factor IF-2, mitochondrial [Anoplophora glabripennis]